MTANHLVRRQLDEIEPGLTDRYDNFVIQGQWNYVCGDLMWMQGLPNQWYGWSSKPQKPIEDHPVFAKHAYPLAVVEAKRVRMLAKQKRIRMIPVLTPLRIQGEAQRLLKFERPHRETLVQLAIHAVRQIFDMDPSLISASLTSQVAFGDIPEPLTVTGKAIHQTVVGYGGVIRQDGRWRVVAKAVIFPLLVHEIVKGVVELICLHGMHQWSEGIYREVTRDADQLEFEGWCIQAGPELWRRLLAVAPRDEPLAEVIMGIAQLPPDPLHALIESVIVAPQDAKRRLGELMRPSCPSETESI